MNYTVKPGQRSGKVLIPSSKSFAHRLLICCALADIESTVICDGISKDIDATIKCLNALGAEILNGEGNKLEVRPIREKPQGIRHLYCGESGSTLRFMIPVVGALGAEAVFHMEGKLPQRPQDALIETLTENGMSIHQEDDLLFCSGQLKAGAFHIPGNISSQYISGLLFALPLLDGESSLTVTGNIESADYIIMTEDAIEKTGIVINKKDNNYVITGNQQYVCGENAVVERDWSNAAFFMCIGALSEKGVTLCDISENSKQGDRAIAEIIRSFGADVDVNGREITVKKNKLIGQAIDAKAIPDLVPTICALASTAQGETRIVNAQRLRIKESDRIKTTKDMLSALGADIKETEDGLIINGKAELSGGEIDAANDHRIAMSAAVAASVCKNEVMVIDAQCVEKSYPDFWKHLEQLEVQS